MPLVKDTLGDITKSGNYRAIAGGCLFPKILDLVILNVEGHKLSTDPLQFAYNWNLALQHVHGLLLQSLIPSRGTATQYSEGL